MAKKLTKRAKQLQEMSKKVDAHVVKAQKAWASEGKNFDQKMRAWMKVLKKDWDSEPDDILIVLKYKLERTRKQLVKNDLTADTKKMEREILAVENLLDKVIKDEYEEECLKPVHAKYGKMKMEFDEEDEDGCHSCRFIWPKAKSQKRASNAQHRAYEKSIRMRQRDLEKAFALLAKNIWGWWD